MGLESIEAGPLLLELGMQGGIVLPELAIFSIDICYCLHKVFCLSVEIVDALLDLQIICTIHSTLCGGTGLPIDTMHFSYEKQVTKLF